MTDNRTPPARWLYQVMGETLGPVHASKLRALARDGNILPDTLVRREGRDDWVAAYRIKGLFDEMGDLEEQFSVDANSPPAIPQATPQFLLSTGDIPYTYELVDLVFASGSSSQGLFKGVEPMAAYQLAAQLLKNIAQEIRADAVLHIRFELRSAVGQGLVAYSVFEVYAYGTAVRCTDERWPKSNKS